MSTGRDAKDASGATVDDRPDAAAADAVELEAKDLPAFCPNRRMPLWSQHPRVFLEVAVTGQARCPYCGTLYRLKPGTLVRGH